MKDSIFKDKDEEEELEENTEQEQEQEEPEESEKPEKPEQEEEEDDAYKPYIARREEELEPGEHRRDKKGRVWLKTTPDED